jgi:thiol-disulfide isomerase/thioredoxin
VCVALVAAMLAGLVASIVIGDDAERGTAAEGPTLLPRGEIDPTALAAVELLTVEGDTTTLPALLDPHRPTVVNLWAQSCAPCIKEMPWLEGARRANPDVAFLGVNVLDRLDNAEAMAAKTGITYPWVRDDDGSFGNAAQSSGLPDTLLIEPDGTVVASKSGVFASQAAIQSWLDEHVK